MSIYAKNLSGLNQTLFVATAAQYTAQTTYAAFVASAAEGEMGVFLDSGAVRTTALTAGLLFFIAQKRDGFVKKTPIIAWDNLYRKLRTAYDAPVKQVTSLGYNATVTASDLSFDFTGASQTNTLTFGISASETTPGNQPFPVQEGYATVNSSTADEYTVLASIVSQLNGDFDYQRTQPDKFVLAEIMGDGTRTALAANATVTNGSKAVAVTAHALTAGTIISLVNVLYKIITVVDANNFLIDRPYAGASGTVTAGTSVSTGSSVTYVSGTNKLGVRLTSISFDTHFKARGLNGLYLSPVLTTTSWKLGSGSGTSIVELEKNDAIFFDGVGSTRNAKFRDDYGQPTLFASASQTYDLFFLDFANKIIPAAGLPVYEQKQIERIMLATPPTGGSSPGDEFQTIFGL